MYPAHYVNYTAEIEEKDKEKELQSLFNKLMQVLSKFHIRYDIEAIIDGVINGMRIYRAVTPKELWEIIETIESFGFKVIEIEAKKDSIFFTVDFREIIKLMIEQNLVRNIGDIEIYGKSSIYITVFKVEAEKNLKQAYKNVKRLINALGIKGEVELATYNSALREAKFRVSLD